MCNLRFVSQASAVQALKEIKFIQDRHSNKVQGRLDTRQQIIEGKLKPKGDALLIKAKHLGPKK